MLQNERKQYILELINRDRIVRAADLVERLGVSMETIRRDLEELEKAGNLRRVYGGAVLGTIYSPEPSYYNREVTHAAQKRAIAAAVYNLIEDEDTLFLDGGTTLMEVARCIEAGNKRVTVITNAVQLSRGVVKTEFCGAILVGGALTRGEPRTSGAIASSDLMHFHANKIILGAAGVSLRYGVTDHSFVIGSLKREMISRADQVICVADFSKFNQTAANCICPTSNLNGLVTDWLTEDAVCGPYTSAGVRVIKAPEPRSFNL